MLGGREGFKEECREGEGGGNSNVSYRGLVNQYLSAFIQAAKDFQGAMKVSIALGLFSFIFLF